MVCECVIECLLPVSNELLVQTFPGFRDLRMKGFLVLLKLIVIDFLLLLVGRSCGL